MKIENLSNKPLWQMTGEEFMFLSESATSGSALKSGLANIFGKGKYAEERALTLTSSLQSRYDALSKEYRSLESATAMMIERLEREKKRRNKALDYTFFLFF